MNFFVILALLCGSLVSTPYDFKEGTPKQEILNSCPDYQFMFEKTITEKINGKMSVGMIGYWEGKKGYVLHFINGKFTSKMEFNNVTEYKNYITNPKESKNIIVKPLKNK